MDFNKYYLNQAGNGFPVFRGTYSQKGYGLGGIFRRFFSWFMPIVKEHALPATKNIGKEIIRGAANYATKYLDANDSGQTFRASKTDSTQNGNGYKRKRNLKKQENYHKSKKKKKKIKFNDIFSR